jgi:hypothetical protein
MKDVLIFITGGTVLAINVLKNTVGVISKLV